MGSRPAVSWLARTRPPLLAVGIAAGVLGLARCATDGLDGYSSGWEGGDGATDDSGDVLRLDGPLVGDAGCDCGLGQACVKGTCETCAATWSLDFPNIAANDEALDTRTTSLYVPGSRAVDAGLTSGYLGVVDECTGKLDHAYDPPAVGAATLQGLNNSVIAGGKLYMRLYAPAPQAGGYTRFDLGSQTFELAVPTLPALSAGSDETWMMTAAASGNVWLSGDMNYAPGPPTPTVGKGVGSSVCWKSYPPQGRSGRAATTDGADVYVVSATNDVIVHHFDDGSCTAPSCACAPTWSSPPLAFGGWTTGAMRAKVIGKKVYVVGWTFAEATGKDWKAWVAALDPSTKTWNNPFVWNPTAKIDAFVGVDADTTFLYLSAAQSYDGATWASAAAKVVVVPVGFDGQAMSTVLDVPRLRVGWNLDLDHRGGFTMSGMSTDNGNDGRAIRCSLQTCPP